MRDLLADACDCMGVDYVVREHLRSLVFCRALSLETMLLVSKCWNSLVRRLLCNVPRVVAVPQGCMTQSYRYWNVRGRLRTLLIVRVHGVVVHHEMYDVPVTSPSDRLTCMATRTYFATRHSVSGAPVLLVHVFGHVNNTDVDETCMKIEYAQMDSKLPPRGVRWESMSVAVNRRRDPFREGTSSSQ